MRDDSERTPLLETIFPKQKIGQPILVGMKSIELRHELPLEKGKSIKTESLDVALTG